MGLLGPKLSEQPEVISDRSVLNDLAALHAKEVNEFPLDTPLSRFDPSKKRHARTFVRAGQRHMNSRLLPVHENHPRFGLGIGKARKNGLPCLLPTLEALRPGCMVHHVGTDELVESVEVSAVETGASTLDDRPGIHAAEG